MGNEACIFTQNTYYTEKFINDADVDMVGVNLGIRAPHPHLSCGGVKDFLIDNIKGQGRDTVDFFTLDKAAIISVVDPKADDSQLTSPTDLSDRNYVAS